MFQLSRGGEYAVRAVIHLASVAPGESCSIREIADMQEIPEPFCRKIVQDLIHFGLVRSTRGVYGGITLAYPAGEVTLLEVIEAVEGPIHLNKCLIGPHECNRIPTCPVHRVWCEAQRQLVEVLRSRTLADLAAEQQELQTFYSP